jgi:uncharacterized membrane protein
MKGHRDLEIVAAGSVLCALAALAIPLSAVSLLFAAPLTLFAPGYAIVAATFAKRSLGSQRVLLLSVALSLATLALGAFLLNYMPGGVRAISWTILLLLVVLNCCRVAALRRPPAVAPRRAPRPRIRPRDGGLLLGGALLAAAALVLAMTTLPAENARGFTELWVTPEAGAVSGTAEIGIGSEEQHAASYILKVQLGRGSSPVLRQLTLHPGETRTLRFDAPTSPPGAQVPVSAQLYRQENPGKVYRRVSAWIPGVPR